MNEQPKSEWLENLQRISSPPPQGSAQTVNFPAPSIPEQQSNIPLPPLRDNAAAEFLGWGEDSNSKKDPLNSPAAVVSRSPSIISTIPHGTAAKFLGLSKPLSFEEQANSPAVGVSNHILPETKGFIPSTSPAPQYQNSFMNNEPQIEYILYYRQGQNPMSQFLVFRSQELSIHRIVERTKKHCDVMGFRFVNVRRLVVDLDEEERKSLTAMAGGND